MFYSPYQLNPDTAFVLVITGIVLICGEFVRPGSVIPGVLGSIATLCGVAGLMHFPLDWRGAALLMASVPCFGAEAAFRMRGAAILAGTAALIAGALLLIPVNPARARIHPFTAVGCAIPFACILTFLFSVAVRARRNKSVVNTRAAIS
jgi:membrane-bound serine protease (ClpP class)